MPQRELVVPFKSHTFIIGFTVEPEKNDEYRAAKYFLLFVWVWVVVCNGFDVDIKEFKLVNVYDELFNIEGVVVKVFVINDTVVVAVLHWFRIHGPNFLKFKKKADLTKIIKKQNKNRLKNQNIFWPEF